MKSSLRGGDHQLPNCEDVTLWRIVIIRLSCAARTKDYLAKRISDGKSKTEVIRFLKRYVAREIYNAMPSPAAV